MVVQQVYKRMNKAQAEWLEYFLESGDDIRAVEIAYPDVAKVNRSSKASKLRARFAEEIDQASRKLYGQLAPKMMNVIKKLALDDTGAVRPSEKLKAADTWLSRAGHDAAQVVEVKETATHEQLLQRLKIATQGIDPTLLAAALPEDLLTQLNKEGNEDGNTKH